MQPLYWVAVLLLLAIIAALLFIKGRGLREKAVKDWDTILPQEAVGLLLSESDGSGMHTELPRLFADTGYREIWKKAILTADAAAQVDLALAVAMHGGKYGREWLLEMWQRNDPGLQLAVARALTMVANKDFLPQVLPFLHSIKPGLPTRAAEVILSLGEEAVVPLVNYLHSTGERKEIIISLLGELHAPQAAGVLIQCLETGSEGERQEAVTALSKLDLTPENRTALAGALQDKSWRVKAQAARIAGLKGMTETAAALENLSDHPRWEVSTHAQKSLKLLGGVDNDAG